ncbi:MAG: gliding motility-associated C-terminal domain-containing protein, partial [Bacteroidia bacterium]|nr:gliding motility-associated C-terminal domain-containing protein [Bacteroidia bacterium]
AQFNVSAAGVYGTTVAYGRCSATDTIQVDYVPLLPQLPDSNLCAPNTLTLNAGMAGSYVWSTGSTAAAVVVSQSGQYVLTVTTAGCIQRDTASVNVQAAPVVDFGGDTVLCPGASLQLDASNAGATYLWQDGSSAPSFLVNASGLYWVNVAFGTCTEQDSVQVVYEPLLELGPDTSICEGAAYTLSSPLPGLAYNWSDGSTSASISPALSGTYALTLTTQFCVQRDSLELTILPVPEVDLGPDSVLCEGESITLDAGNPGSAYTWSNGSATQQVLVELSGNYIVEVNDGFCTGSDTVLITVAEFDNLQSSISICNEFEVILEAQKGGSTFLWSTGATSASITVQDTGVYWVETKIGRCSVRDTVAVEGAPGFSQVYLPRAFTPNRDGKNDQFFGLGERLEDYSLRVYNRWGQEVFQTSESMLGWDGTYDGMEAPTGMYVYKVVYKTPCSQNRPSEKMGTVMLIR